jgi:prepilin-type N-terminal cleavage/methylation domain-containing protein
MMLTWHRAGRLRGFSLLEMIVVLAVVASLLGLAMPAMLRPLTKTQLREAARQVQAAMSDARARALESGLDQEFRYEPGGRNYEIRTHGQADLVATPDLPKPAMPGASGQRVEAPVLQPQRDVLPDGITFADPQEEKRAEPPEPSTPTSSAAVEDNAAGQRWITLVRFYANGQSRNARLKLCGTKNWSAELLLRGLTGTVLVEQPRHEETEQEGSPQQPWSPEHADSH